MENIQDLLDSCVESVTNSLLKPSEMRKWAKEAGDRLSREDAISLRATMIPELKRVFMDKMNAMIEENEIDRKLKELAMLSEECAENGEEEGFRPTGIPEVDIEGEIAETLIGYKESLQKFSEGMDEKIAENQELIKNNMKVVDKLAACVENRYAERDMDDTQNTELFVDQSMA